MRAHAPPTLPALVTHDLVVEARRERWRHRRRLLALTGRIWVRLILPLLFVTTCGAAIMAPCYLGSSCRARQSEAKTNLKALFVAQVAFADEHARFSTSFDELGWEARGTKVRYRYVIERADDEGFSAIAVATLPASLAGDVWRITEKNDLRNLENGCR